VKRKRTLVSFVVTTTMLMSMVVGTSGCSGGANEPAADAAPIAKDGSLKPPANLPGNALKKPGTK